MDGHFVVVAIGSRASPRSNNVQSRKQTVVFFTLNPDEGGYPSSLPGDERTVNFSWGVQWENSPTHTWGEMPVLCWKMRRGVEAVMRNACAAVIGGSCSDTVSDTFSSR